MHDLQKRSKKSIKKMFESIKIKFLGSFIRSVAFVTREEKKKTLLEPEKMVFFALYSSFFSMPDYRQSFIQSCLHCLLAHQMG